MLIYECVTVFMSFVLSVQEQFIFINVTYYCIIIYDDTKLNLFVMS